MYKRQGPDVATVPVDIFEDEDAFIVRLEVPGVKREALEVNLEGRALSVKVTEEVADDDNEEGGRATTAERTLTVPETVDGTAVKAALADGILTLTLPKLEEAKPRVITIE